ncbi:MAG TPA: PspC domain-containing protein [Saprospiraceae bacterium]|nr:PspC domain-containing protein [Saprospiraceae bacterium]HHH52430.1 PspC domain-containing protein [Bacteroidota bacterium]
MKKIVNINLGGYPYTIDVDAYDKMEKYFSSLENYFKGYDNPHEIIFDIEVRMAELFKENIGTNSIISMNDLDKAIAILGTPEDFSKENVEESFDDADRSESRGSQSSSKRSSEYRVGRKIYRDVDNKIIGGVCSGLANYLGIPDPIWIRLLFVILFVSGISPIIYIILMIIIPKATTETEKREMRGEPIDIDTIANSIEEEFQNITDQFQDFAKSFKSKKKERRNRRKYK